MEYINTNILCLNYEEFISFFGLETYKSDKKRNLMTVRGFGGNGRKVFIEYESLQPKRKMVITEKIGNPYEYLAKQPILDLIDWDFQAQSFYSRYVLPNGDKLPNTDRDAKGKPQINYVERYTKANNWLVMLDKITNDKKALKNQLNLSVMEFWDTVSELIIKENIAIPANPKRLKEKVKQYISIKDIENRYASLVDVNKFGNKHKAKIKGEDSEGLLLKMLSDPKKHDYTVVAAAYNIWAKKAKNPTITSSAVGYFARQNEHIIAPVRDGLKKAANIYGKDIKRDRTSAPLLFINADDNCLDLFFEVEKIKADGKVQKSKHYRPMLYVIIDTYNDYILGYAVGDTVTHELVYTAFRNAINHIAELTGAYYLPHQLQTDRWGLDVKYKNQLGEFYKKVAKFTPQAYGQPQGKYIERSFGVEWHQVLKAMPNNHYAGQNITAKERLSAEYIVQASKNYPNIERMPQIVEGFINVMRNKANPKTGISRKQEWIDAFNANEKSKAKAIDTALKLEIFGKKYQIPTRPNEPAGTITKSGLTPVINGQKIDLDIPAEIIYQHNGKKVDIIYDPENLSEMMITDNKNLRFIAGQYQRHPSAIADYEAGDVKRLNNAWDEKRYINKLMVTTIHERMQTIGHINAESLIQGGVLIKDMKNDAEREYLEAQYQHQIESPKVELPVLKKQLKAPAKPPKKQTQPINFYDLL